MKKKHQTMIVAWRVNMEGDALQQVSRIVDYGGILIAIHRLPIAGNKKSSWFASEFTTGRGIAAGSTIASAIEEAKVRILLIGIEKTRGLIASLPKLNELK